MTIKTDTDTSTPKFSLNSQRVQLRFGKAFPELVKCFTWLTGGYRSGARWTDLVDSHLKRIGHRRWQLLLAEIDDVAAFGFSATHDYEVLLCVVLGLDSALLDEERLDAREFLTCLRERVVRDALTTTSQN